MIELLIGALIGMAFGAAHGWPPAVGIITGGLVVGVPLYFGGGWLAGEGGERLQEAVSARGEASPTHSPRTRFCWSPRVGAPATPGVDR
jgi:hypothetical protein